MRDYLEQVERASDANLYYVALTCALVIPDLGGALDAKDGRATPERYEAWFDQHVQHRYTYHGRVYLTGEDCYGLRCSLLHQGRLRPHRGAYGRVIFVEPGATGNVFHMNVLENALNIDVRIFVADMVAAAHGWLEAVEGSEPFASNYAASMQRHPEGLRPFITGIPVIG